MSSLVWGIVHVTEPLYMFKQQPNMENAGYLAQHLEVDPTVYWLLGAWGEDFRCLLGAWWALGA